VDKYIGHLGICSFTVFPVSIDSRFQKIISPRATPRLKAKNDQSRRKCSSNIPFRLVFMALGVN